ITSAFALTVSDSWVATAWLLPSLALAGLVLTTSRWVDLPLAAAGVGALYALAVGSVLLSHVNVRTLFDAQVQLLSLVVAVGCLFAVLVPARSRASFRRIS
ncbi:MAG TPA: hypothetical protein VMT27_00685, partial [Actinomycetes bacterium]|nr:hypothetical protein [Actinomycetes bacterium]